MLFVVVFPPLAWQFNCFWKGARCHLHSTCILYTLNICFCAISASVLISKMIFLVRKKTGLLSVPRVFKPGYYCSKRHKSCRHNQFRIPETVRLISDYWQTIATPPSTARVVSCTCHRSRWPGLCLHRAGSAYIGACFIFHCSTKAFQLGKKTAAFPLLFFSSVLSFYFFFLSFFFLQISVVYV